MDWIQFSLFATGILGLFFWNRAENRADYRHLHSLMESQINIIDEMRKESARETKDFHGRLCTLEEKFINWMMRKS